MTKIVFLITFLVQQKKRPEKQKKIDRDSYKLITKLSEKSALKMLKFK